MAQTAVRARAARRTPAERSAEILAIALEVFSERGYENTPVSVIADRLGVVEGTIYKYFESKRQLLGKVLVHWNRGMIEEYVKHLPGIKGTRQRLRYVIWRHVQTIRERPVLCRIMFSEVRAEFDHAQAAFYEENRVYTRFLITVLEEGVASGEFRKDLPLELVRDMVFGCIERHSWNYMWGRGGLDVDTIVDQIVAIICDGILAPNRTVAVRDDSDRLAGLVQRLENLLPPHTDRSEP
ncbi:MAG: TetR/AcrR family transcriptional regulator [Candidatus Binatia bacterium]